MKCIGRSARSEEAAAQAGRDRDHVACGAGRGSAQNGKLAKHLERKHETLEHALWGFSLL